MNTKYSLKAVYQMLSLVLALVATPLISYAQNTLEPFENLGDPDQDLNSVLDVITKATKLSITWVLAILIIVLMITGFKYITSLGNTAQVETAKKSFLYIIIGLLIVLGAYAVLSKFSQFSL